MLRCESLLTSPHPGAAGSGGVIDFGAKRMQPVEGRGDYISGHKELQKQ